MARHRHDDAGPWKYPAIDGLSSRPNFAGVK